MSTPNNPLTAGPEGAAKAVSDAKDFLAKAPKYNVEGDATKSITSSPAPTYKSVHKARKASVSDLVDQAGAENTKPREDALKALTGGTGSSAL